MSKSLGNIIDPLDLIKVYGADALRMALIVGVGPGADNNLGEDKVKAYGKFANKIWNATRFVIENTAGFDDSQQPKILPAHKNFIDEWKNLTKEITKEMEEYKLYLVGEKLYHFFWHRFADVIIEECKKDLGAQEAGGGRSTIVGIEKSNSAKYTLNFLLKEQLRALHPFMPFITEEVWGLIHDGNPEKLLIIEAWPE
jgi:valyl-tRNA synthetase